MACRWCQLAGLVAALLLAGCGSSEKAAPARPAPMTPTAVATPPPPPAPPTESEVQLIRMRLIEATNMYRVYHKAWPTSAQETLKGLPYEVVSPAQVAIFDRIVHQPQPDGSLALILTWTLDGRPRTERYQLGVRED